ncbi:MAG: NAD(P)/FAD-dependent oxidoreductase [Clostridia bacterium]|nr:NAD(P)/FAD-dependent oxidoreductase [Clostridia bacterium]
MVKNELFDVIVIGGGVVGGLIARELTKYRLKVCLVEKESDVCMGASKANSGIVHAGYDALPGTLKAKFNVEGNKLMEKTAGDLGVKFRRNGSLVVAFSEDEIKVLEKLKERGEKNGVETEIIGQEKLRALEPNVSSDALAALFAPSGGIVCPYELTIAAIGNAMDNGASLETDFCVSSIEKITDGIAVKSEKKAVFGKVVINCAGLGGGAIAALAGDDYFRIGARKGEYVLLDRESGNFISRTLFFTPTEKGKGILATPTVDGNILFGPTAEPQESGDVSTSAAGLSHVLERAAKMCNKPPFSNIITSFAGVRAYSDRHDFIIEKSRNTEGLIHCVGIESPGLTASPAIAKYVAEELVGSIILLEKNESFCGTRAPDNFFSSLSAEEKNEIIKKDPSFGKIVCRCEQVTEGEIIRALRVNPPAKDIDGVKRRTRSGMGRCQGGFCQPQVAEIISRELGVPLTSVTKCGGKSELLTGRTK